jgi:hypothetical protein
MNIISKVMGILCVVFALTAGAPRLSAADMTSTVDEIAIQHLFADYVFALDLLDPEGYAALYTPDGVVTMGPRTLRGREEIRQLIENYRKDNDFDKIKADSHGRKFGKVRHVNTAFLINVNGDTATSESYWMEVRSNADMNGIGDRPSIINMGRYEDDLVKQDGKWLFRRRSIIADMYDPTQGGRQ